MKQRNMLYLDKTGRSAVIMSLFKNGFYHAVFERPLISFGVIKL